MVCCRVASVQPVERASRSWPTWVRAGRGRCRPVHHADQAVAVDDGQRPDLVACPSPPQRASVRPCGWPPAPASPPPPLTASSNVTACHPWPRWTGPPANPSAATNAPGPVSWSTSTSKSSAASPTAAATSPRPGGRAQKDRRRHGIRLPAHRPGRPLPPGLHRELPDETAPTCAAFLTAPRRRTPRACRLDQAGLAGSGTRICGVVVTLRLPASLERGDPPLRVDSLLRLAAARTRPRSLIRPDPNDRP